MRAELGPFCAMWLVVLVCLLVIFCALCTTFCIRQPRDEPVSAALSQDPLVTLPVIGMGPDGHWFASPGAQRRANETTAATSEATTQVS